MNALGLINLMVCVALVTWATTLLLERNAHRLDLVQAPNARSSHTIPTPRGGGLAIAIGGTLAAISLGFSLPILFVLGGLSIVLAALGFADDLKSLGTLPRFAVQIGALVALNFALGTLPPLPLIASLAVSGVLLSILIVIVGVWWINLFNFMDGIDGIAAGQSILILLAASALAATTAPSALIWLMLSLAAAAAGFLQRNWPPAKIFMGDVGSNYLAFAIFGCALLTVQSGALTYLSWLILVGVFVCDATATLLVRLARRERVFDAHRRHGYQFLARRWGHRSITLLYGAITALWCVPLAYGALRWPALQWPFVIIAYVPLLALALRNGAGRPETLPNTPN